MHLIIKLISTSRHMTMALLLYYDLAVVLHTVPHVWHCVYDFDTFEFQSMFSITIMCHNPFFPNASHLPRSFVCFHFISYCALLSARSLSLFVIYELTIIWNREALDCEWFSSHHSILALHIYLFIFSLPQNMEASSVSTSLHSFVFVDVLPQWFAFPRIAISFGFDCLFIFFICLLARLCAKLNRMLLFPHIFWQLALSKRKNIYEIKIHRHILALLHERTRARSSARTHEECKWKKTKLADWKKQKEARAKNCK